MTPGQFEHFVNTATDLLASLNTGKTGGQTYIKGRVLSSDINSTYPPISTPHDSNTATYQVDVLWGIMKCNISIAGYQADVKSASFAMELKIAKVPFCQSGTNFVIP